MYAVLDLGSNSFHLVIAEKAGGRINILDTLNHKVQLADGLNETGKISRQAFERASTALDEFRHELSRYPITCLCIVGTSTLREAKNAARFIQEANARGFPVNVISGIQEAYYIYQGIHALLSPASKQRLVFDIGGGSTEFAVGSSAEPELLDSLPIGCVTYCPLMDTTASTEKITRKTLAKIRRKVHEVLDKKLKPEFYELDWEEVYASSGTAKMLRAIARANKLDDGTITSKSLLEIEDMAIDLGSYQALEKLAGLKPNRRNVFVSGLAIMQGLMDHLGLDHVEYSDFALREGILLSMVKQGNLFPLFTLHSDENETILL
jgi:exopolyphosphatase/guanosine-5'-triphosphate,3'-diphosphate pyrophosphatase